MNEKEARPTVAAAEQANGNAVNIFQCDFNPLAAGNQSRISSFLRPGQENAVTLRDLRSMTGLDGRTIRLEIERARRGGIPVISGASGYFLPKNHTEIDIFVRSMLRRAREIEITARAVRRCRLD